MTSKERVLSALDHQEPDRVPVYSTFTPEFAGRLQEHLKLPQTFTPPHRAGMKYDLEVALDLDIIQYSVGIVNSYFASQQHEYICEWGITWKQAKYETRFGEGKYAEMVEHPLGDDSRIKDYVPPGPHRPKLYKPLEYILGTYGKEFCIMGAAVCTIFEGAWYLRGMEKLLIDMIENEELASDILDIPFEYHLEVAKKLTQMGVDIIWLGDDVGTQEGLLISPQLWRKYLLLSRGSSIQGLIHPQRVIIQHPLKPCGFF